MLLLYDAIDFVGYAGPLILLVVYSFLLIKQPFILSWVVVLFIANIGLNKILKGIIKEPRPEIPINYKNEEKYGMPSGHMQLVTFLTAYMYLFTNSNFWLGFGVIISTFTFIQRFKYKYHTINQLFVGSFVGVCVAFCFDYIVKSIGSRI
jgi:membrane-associated phospholipid phosphatase